MLKLPTLGEMDRAMSGRMFLCAMAADMRKGFDSLAALVRDHLGHDPLCGDLFLFVGRGRDRLKILYWDTDGFAIWYKRLEEGTFRLPAIAAGQKSVQIRPSELAMLLEGIDLKALRRSPRFGRERVEG
jgi:transposase